jgi:uncharacterized OB-fold protein
MIETYAYCESCQQTTRHLRETATYTTVRQRCTKCDRVTLAPRHTDQTLDGLVDLTKGKS